jgi:sterol desaturase/sphingolipid hydroxylase (fatty acid hydroxylase superfamily)
MTIDAYLRTVAAILAGMALLSVIETLAPFFHKPDWRRRHRFPNLALAALTLSLNFAFNAGAVIATAWLTARGFGLLAGVPIPAPAMLLLGIVVLDGSTYACHRLLHALPPLWKVHAVHHSDPLVDVTTTTRQHPIEGLWRFLFIMTPAWALGISVEAVAAYRVVSVLIGLAEHTNVKLWQPLDRALSGLVCTPNMHKLHHSRRAIETDTNYGNILSWFDRAFGTFTPSDRAAHVETGLAGFDDAGSQGLGSLLRLPFRSRET